VDRVIALRDRRDAGRQLATRLGHLAAAAPVVVGLPRGGVPVAYEVARALGAPLDVIVVRKLGVPGQPELGMGAVGEGGVLVVTDSVVRAANVPSDRVDDVARRETDEVDRRARRFRGGRPMIPLAGRTAVIVDDGLATGGTARAAVQVARAHGAERVVLAVPVAPPATARDLAREADEVVALAEPEPFLAVGAFYEDFTQTTDDEVAGLLAAAEARDEEGLIDVGDAVVGGHLTVPPEATGVVVFAHGSGSSRHSPRNRSVAERLHAAGLGTLLFDLLTEAEARERANVFAVDRLGARLLAALAWLRERSTAPIGCFGASTGAAAALWAAAEPHAGIGAVVSRGGRPDLAGSRLAAVTAPTLLIVGGADTTVLELNHEAARRLRCEHRVEVVPGATHLFEEPGALERVADLATGWFRDHLGR
jgi:predicted phosphoribosyltransferase/dienelactone hydrolase